MSDVSSTTGTAYADLDWTNYIRYRPSYPPSLRDLIYKYHTQDHPQNPNVPDDSSPWDLLLDIGGGIGISSIPFISDFRTVHLVDPSPMNHQQARVFLSEHVSAHNLQTKLEFTVAKAEDCISNPPETGASMAICVTAAHFIDSDTLVQAMHKSLRPGGTLAIYSYFCPALPDLDPALSTQYVKVLTKALELCVRDEATAKVFAGAAARLCAGSSIVDVVGVPEDLFECVQRIRINPQTAALTLDKFREDPPVPYTPLGSRVRESEEKHTYVDGTDPEAEGWGFTVGLDFLHGMIRTILPADVGGSKEHMEELFGEFDRMFDVACPSGSTRAMYGLDMILAKKRG